MTKFTPPQSGVEYMPHGKPQNTPDAPTLNKRVYVKPELILLAGSNGEGNNANQPGTQNAKSYYATEGSGTSFTNVPTNFFGQS